jgi:hypothetical protein
VGRGGARCGYPPDLTTRPALMLLAVIGRHGGPGVTTLVARGRRLPQEIENAPH